jgi:N-formylglutamate amidohydrolase
MRELGPFIDFREGNIPLILSVPHGGILECDSLPQRSTGFLGIDKGTINLSIELAEKIKIKFKEEQLGNIVPFYIYSKVRRSKVDLNRIKSEAFDQNSFLARELYIFYHNKIEEWIYNNLRKFDRSFLIDIHGFERNARPTGFRDVELILGTNNLKSLISKPIPKKDWEKNLRGKIIQAFLQLNIPIAPGHVRRREYVLTGGYITKKYGASNIPKSQAIQIEFSDNIRMYNSNLRGIVLRSITDILYRNFLCKLDI